MKKKTSTLNLSKWTPLQRLQLMGVITILLLLVTIYLNNVKYSNISGAIDLPTISNSAVVAYCLPEDTLAQCDPSKGLFSKQATSNTVSTTYIAPVPVDTVGSTHTFYVDADARIEESSPYKNMGKLTQLTASAGDKPDREFLVRFATSGLTNPVKSAKLRMYVTNTTLYGFKVYPTTPTWSENTVTWKTKPARTDIGSAQLTGATKAGWFEIDVTNWVNGNGVYSFNVVSTHVDSLSAYSKEGNFTNRAQLVVVTQ